MIWSGQHYSKNLKDTFFKELKLPKPDIELNCSGDDNLFISKYFKKLDNLLINKRPKLVIFLGDTNTIFVMNDSKIRKEKNRIPLLKG